MWHRITRKFKINRGARLTVQRRFRENAAEVRRSRKNKNLLNGRIPDKTANGWCFAASGSIALVSGRCFPGVSGRLVIKIITLSPPPPVVVTRSEQIMHGLGVRNVCAKRKSRTVDPRVIVKNEFATLRFV